MYDIRWADEPDITELHRLHNLLSTNPLEALAGLKSLADRGSIVSMLHLGEAYRRGKCEDLNLAKHWYERADQMGSGHAAYMLGHIFLELRDHDAALAAFSRGAKRQYMPALYRLAKMYQLGIGTQKNINECRTLLEAAAARGHLFAERDLATLFIKGEFGVKLVVRGILMLFGLFVDLILVTIEALRRGPTVNERMLG